MVHVNSTVCQQSVTTWNYVRTVTSQASSNHDYHWMAVEGHMKEDHVLPSSPQTSFIMLTLQELNAYAK